MTRRKVNLVWIPNDTARKSSLKKRRAGLLKKVSELCILCDVTACAIIYSPEEAEPIFFPHTRPEVEEIIQRFEQIPEMDRKRKMMDQESYLKERAAKHQEQLRKTMKKNREMQMCHFLHQICRAGKPFSEFAPNLLHGLRCYVEEKWKDCRRRMQFFNQTTGEQIPRSSVHMANATEGTDQTLPQPQVIDEHQGQSWFFSVLQYQPNVRIGGININEGNAPTVNVPGPNIRPLDKGKAVLLPYEGTSSHHGGRMVELPEPLGGNMQEMPQGQAGGDGEGTSVPHSAFGVIGGGLPWEIRHGSVDAFGSGGMSCTPNEAGGGENGYELGGQLPYTLTHSMYLINASCNQSVLGDDSGYAEIPFLEGTQQGLIQGSSWPAQPSWDVDGNATGYTTPMMLNSYGDDGGKISGYASMQQPSWNMEGSGTDHGIAPTHGHKEGGSNLYNILPLPQNLVSAPGDSLSNMMLLQAQDARGTDSYNNMVLHQEHERSNNGGFLMIKQRQGGSSNDVASDMVLPQGQEHIGTNDGGLEPRFPQYQGRNNTDGIAGMLPQGHDGEMDASCFRIMMLAQAYGESNTGGFGAMPAPQGDIGISSSGFGLIPQGTDRGPTGGFNSVVHQGLEGSNQQQENLPAPAGGRGNIFPLGLDLEDPANTEEPNDPWGPYYRTGPSSEPRNFGPRSGEGNGSSRN